MNKFIAFLGVSAIAMFSSEALAWAPLDAGYPRWDKMPVQYRVNEGTIPPSIAAIGKARLDQGLASWGAPNCTVWATQNLGNTATTYNANDGQNVFMWASGSWPQELGPVNSVIGVTMPVWDGSNVIFDADIVFNNVGFCWNDNGLNNCVDTLSIATHEQGHFLGLDHSNVGGATMEPYYGGGNSIASLEQDDIDGVCALYPAMGGAVSSAAGGAMGDCNSCANTASQGACSSQFNQCGSSQDCVAFYNCYSNCGNQACADQCAAQHPTGAGIWNQFVDCVCGPCASACAGVCGSSSGSSSSSSGNGASSSGSSGNPGTGGANGAGGSTGSWTSDEEDPPPPTNNDGSCSCSMEPAPMRFGAFLGFGALALGLMRRRSRSTPKR